MKSVLITGCNRGIGLDLVKHLLKEDSLQHIISTCRNPNEATSLQDVKSNTNKVHILQLDLKDFNSHGRIAKEVSSIIGDAGLNVLINNAGISTKSQTDLNLVKAEYMIEHLTTNTVAPLMLTKALISLLKQASSVNATLPLSTARAAIINMSSKMGSIAENVEEGGYYQYRCSKAALNAVTRSLSIDLKPDNILAVSIHPGWIKTDMGGPQAPLTLDTAIPALVKLLGSLGPQHNGGFYQYDGKQLPW